VLAKPKQIIIDKESLIGINIDKLCFLAKSHLLLACDTLLYECATTSESARKDMLGRYKRIIEAGAYHCSCSVGYLQYEGRSGSAYPWFLPDLNATEQIRSKKAQVDDLLDTATAEEIFQTRLGVAKNIFLRFSKNIKTRLDSRESDVGKAIKNLPSSTFERFQTLLGYIDSGNLHESGVNSLPRDLIKDETKFCLSPEWISWQFIRLISVIVQNYYYLRQMGGPPGDDRAEHDYQDMEYVLLLSRADGILTNDQSLIKPLAKAAFPDKQVFSSIEEIPSN
jgi:hypothetical protein